MNQSTLLVSPCERGLRLAFIVESFKTSKVKVRLDSHELNEVGVKLNRHLKFNFNDTLIR